MKRLYLLSAIFLVLTLVSCSDEKAPNEPDITDNEKLNNRSTELFNQGIAVVEAAETIFKEFSFETDVLLKSLYKSGYPADDITKAIHIAFEYNPVLAEPILNAVLTNKTVSDVAELILAEYTTELKQKSSDLKYFIQKVDAPERRVLILKDLYDKQPLEILLYLNVPGEDVTEIIRLLISNFSLSEEDVKVIILDAELTVREIAGVLKSVYSTPAAEVTQFLYENGYALDDILIVLKDLYNLTIFQVSEILESLNFQTSKIASKLITLNYTFEEIAVLLKDHFLYSAKETIVLFKSLNASAGQSADVLKNVYGQTVPELIVTLYDAGYSVDDILDVLKNHFSLGIQEIIDLVKYIGIDQCEVLQFFNIPC